MAAISTTGTLTAGSSKTFNLAPGSALSLTLSPNVRVTITETPETVSGSGVGGNTTRVHEPQLPGTFAYGPYAMGGVVVVAVASNSGSSVTWTRKDTVVTTNSDGTSLVSGDGTAQLTWPAKISEYVIAHRGGPAVQHENSMSAFMAAYAAGCRHIEMDVRVTSNGSVILMHDATTTRTTDTADTVASTTTAALQAAKLDIMNVTGGNGYGRTENPPLLAEVLAWACDKPLTLWIELKVQCGDAVVMELQQHQIPLDRAVLQSFTQGHLTPAITAGYKTLLLHTGSMASVNFTTIAAAGTTHVGGDTWTTGQVASCKAAGLIPVAYTVYYRKQALDFQALGIDYLMWADPEVSKGLIRAKTVFAGGKFPSGIVGGDSVSLAQLTERGTMFASGGWGWASSTATYFEAAWQNWYGDLPASYTMTIVASIDAVADAAKWLNILICSPDDGAWTNPGGTLEQSGYQFLVRQNGTIDLYLLAAGGTSSNIGTASGTAFTLGTSYTMTVTVTPTTVSITANGTTVSATNSAYRGSRFAIGRGNADIKVTSIAIA